jgi:hypothetical protein
LSKGQVIGESDLEGGDLDTRVASGQFHPAEAYETVRQIFRDLSEASQSGDHRAIERCCRLRDDLELTLQDAEGQEITVGWVEIQDFSSTLGATAYHVEIEILEPDFFRPPKR